MAAVGALGSQLWSIFGEQLHEALREEGVAEGARIYWLPFGALGTFPLGLAQDPKTGRRLADDYEIVCAVKSRRWCPRRHRSPSLCREPLRQCSPDDRLPRLAPDEPAGSVHSIGLGHIGLSPAFAFSEAVAPCGSDPDQSRGVTSTAWVGLARADRVLPREGGSWVALAP